MKGLNIYLLSEKRGTDIISRNKEGIYSIFGETTDHQGSDMLFLARLRFYYYRDTIVIHLFSNKKGVLFLGTVSD